MVDSVCAVVRKSWLQPFRTKSNYSRQYANEVAVAASLGLITVRIGKDSYDRMWRVTRKGLDYIGE